MTTSIKHACVLMLVLAALFVAESSQSAVQSCPERIVYVSMVRVEGTGCLQGKEMNIASIDGRVSVGSGLSKGAT